MERQRNPFHLCCSSTASICLGRRQTIQVWRCFSLSKKAKKDSRGRQCSCQGSCDPVLHCLDVLALKVPDENKTRCMPWSRECSYYETHGDFQCSEEALGRHIFLKSLSWLWSHVFCKLATVWGGLMNFHVHVPVRQTPDDLWANWEGTRTTSSTVVWLLTPLQFPALSDICLPLCLVYWRR